jgi:chemotaxis signal transduction protein
MTDNETLQGQPGQPLSSDAISELVGSLGPASSQSGRSLVLMNVRGHLLAVDAERVERIAPPNAVTALPRAPAHIEGLMLAGSAALPVVDLGTLLQLEDQSREEDDAAERMVVVCAGELSAAIRCSLVRIVRDVPHERLKSVTVTTGDALLRHAERELELGNQVAVVLNLRSALEAARVRRA